MPSIFSRLKGRDGKKKKGVSDADAQPVQPSWTDAWTRTSVAPEEVQELVRRCTEELKGRALDHPFLLLPFRPTSNPSAVRTFIRHFFDPAHSLRGENLAQELRMTEPMVLAGVIKWCWSRLQGGIVGWGAYDLFKVGEQDSSFAPDSFKTFIPLSVDNGARSCIIFDYFELMSAIAAFGKLNGLSGRTLPRLAAWWAFEHKDTGAGFDGGYKAWQKAADATTHLFFAYLRSLEQPRSAISLLPMSLQKLLRETPYPPQSSPLVQHTQRVVMVVDAVSPTPFSLLRRANHFHYRDEDHVLNEYSGFDDPLDALTDECRRVLRAISAANQSQASNSKHSTGLRDASWSRFEDLGFNSPLDDETSDDDPVARPLAAMRASPASALDLGRPTTPSWADFLSAGFNDETHNGSSMLLPPDKVLPPIDIIRQRSAQSHYPRLETESKLEPGELANIIRFDLDDSFWWVWMTSLAPEETAERKAAFGRCAVIEVTILGGQWLVVEEMVAGAAPAPQDGAYVAEKKGLFSWRRTVGIARRKSASGKPPSKAERDKNLSKASIGPDQHARIQAAAAQLQARQRAERLQQEAQTSPVRRGRSDHELMHEKTNSIMTLQPTIIQEASPAMKWANNYDKSAIRDAYLTNNSAGRGVEMPLTPSSESNGFIGNGNSTHEQAPEAPAKDLPPRPLTPPAASESQPERLPEVPAKAQVGPVSPVSQQHPASGRNTPLLPDDIPRFSMATPDPLDQRLYKKLQKEPKEPRGLRKLFSRRRSSKVPENATVNVGEFLRQAAASPEPEPPKALPKTPPEAARAITPPDVPASIHDQERAETPVAPQSAHGSAQDTLSRLDSAEMTEADSEFSRFDQGPLPDQPAFVPDSDSEEDEEDDYDDATPPPIQRHRPGEPLETIPDDEDVVPAEVPMARWAQIRRNAAERAAAQRAMEDRSSGFGFGRAIDDDASGEETIESRVARIKARVASISVNMDGLANGGGPGARPIHSLRD